MLLVLMALGAVLGAYMGDYIHDKTKKEVESDRRKTKRLCAFAGMLGWLVCGLLTQDTIHALLYGELFSLLTAVFVIDWGYVGIKLLNGEYDVRIGDVSLESDTPLCIVLLRELEK